MLLTSAATPTRLLHVAGLGGWNLPYVLETSVLTSSRAATAPQAASGTFHAAHGVGVGLYAVGVGNDATHTANATHTQTANILHTSGPLPPTSAPPPSSCSSYSSSHTWLSAGHDAQEPCAWWQADPSRRAWLLRLLSMLTGETAYETPPHERAYETPYKQACPGLAPVAAAALQPTLATALFAVMASDNVDDDNGGGGKHKAGGGGKHKGSSVGGWRQEAKQLLAQRRGQHVLWWAYAVLEGQQGGAKVCRWWCGVGVLYDVGYFFLVYVSCCSVCLCPAFVLHLCTPACT